MGRTNRFTYDSRKRISSSSDPQGTTTNYSYDPAGNLLGITRGGATTSITYDSADHIASITDPAGNKTDYSYATTSSSTTEAIWEPRPCL